MKFNVFLAKNKKVWTEDELIASELETEQLPNKGDFIRIGRETGHFDYFVLEIVRCYVKGKEVNNVFVSDM